MERNVEVQKALENVLALTRRLEELEAEHAAVQAQLAAVLNIQAAVAVEPPVGYPYPNRATLVPLQAPAPATLPPVGATPIMAGIPPCAFCGASDFETENEAAEHLAGCDYAPL